MEMVSFLPFQQYGRVLIVSTEEEQQIDSEKVYFDHWATFLSEMS